MPILWFEECEDANRVGGKAAGLARLLHAGVEVPPGFAVTVDVFRALLADGLGTSLARVLGSVETRDTEALEAVSGEARRLVEEARVLPSVRDAVHREYAELCRRAGVGEDELPVAVRSSATAEDLPDASFAGQQDTYLWVIGADAVLEHIRRCWSSLYTARAIGYRLDRGYGHEGVLMSVCVQKMVDARSAGVTFTLNPINGDRSKVAIESSWGLGESVVSGEVTPDNFLVDKVTFDIVRKEISNKVFELRPDPTARTVLRHEIPSERARAPSLSDDEILTLTRLARAVEDHHGCPQDLEWAIEESPDGDSVVFLLQSRPETVWSGRPRPPVSANGVSTMDYIVAHLVRGVRVRGAKERRIM